MKKEKIVHIKLNYSSKYFILIKWTSFPEFIKKIKNDKKRAQWEAISKYLLLEINASLNFVLGGKKIHRFSFSFFWKTH